MGRELDATDILAAGDAGAVEFTTFPSRGGCDCLQINTVFSTFSALPVVRRLISALSGMTNEVLRSRIA